ncbi:MAG: 4-alpha-glucanotransferase [Ruminococcus sp.]|nr:4-alpha-glucanotransferase [Ruminococcus sp.]
MRASGILMHISSLPGRYGIGKMGKEARAFADFLKKSGQSYWQILPVSPTSYGDSPYQSFSVYAGNPYFIDFDQLEAEGLLKKAEYCRANWGSDPSCVDYELLYKKVFPVLKKAYARFRPDDAYKAFEEENASWLGTYALFMSLKDAHGGKAWAEWEKPLRMHEAKAVAAAEKKYSAEIGFWKFVQFEYFKQWKALKGYVNSLGIDMIGDIPIYVAYDSAEVWATPGYFLLDEDKKPIDVAGCPPDVFTAKGQLWGNPLYRWDVMAAEDYKWWIDRIRAACEMYDVVRIDHFRGFESYYTIPYGNEDAIIGEWRKGPDMALFKEVKKQLGKCRIIAEDLGFITPKVAKLLKASGFPGMKVLEFAFDASGESTYLPHNFQNTNSICYTGTHDNETLTGWARGMSRKDAAFARKYLNVKRNKEIPEAVIRAAWASVSETAIAQMQDFLGLDNKARMNTPSTLGGNWQWRASSDDFTDELAEKIFDLTKTYGRLAKEKTNKHSEENNG